MKEKIEIDDLKKVSGGSTEVIHEVASDAYSAFMKVYTSGGTISDLDKIMKEVEDKIIAYSTKEGKLVDNEDILAKTLVKGYYDAVVELMINNPLKK